MLGGARVCRSRRRKAGEMNAKAKLVAGAVIGLAALALGAGAGIASGADDDTPLRGRSYERATAAALEHVGEGTVVETEVGDDAAAYEVEVRLDDASTVEVALDVGFAVIGSESDDDRSGGAASEKD
jgi:hypothetical protein